MKTIAIANQKGGTGKTTTTVNLGVALAQDGYRVLMVDFDPQANLSSYLGIEAPDGLSKTISTLMEREINDKTIIPTDFVQSADGVDFIPSNIVLADMEDFLHNTMCRETVLRSCLAAYQEKYDYCLIDCAPALGLLLVNALAASNEVIIPVQAQPFALEGMRKLMKNYFRVKKKINPSIEIGGIVMTMTDKVSRLCREICQGVRETYGARMRVFETTIPRNEPLKVSTEVRHSIFLYDAKCKGAQAYRELAKEVEDGGRKRQIPNRGTDALSR